MIALSSADGRSKARAERPDQKGQKQPQKQVRRGFPCCILGEAGTRGDVGDPLFCFWLTNAGPGGDQPCQVALISRGKNLIMAKSVG
jgi:hypothetical protein